MGAVKAVAVACAFLLVAGCGYGPQHLNAFYATRDHYQKLIDDIEQRHHLQSRDAAKRERERREETEAERAAFTAWFASLTPEQRFQWMLAEKQAQIQREWRATEKEK